MTIFHILLLAVVQGVTEFLPISSSAHLILPSALLDFPDQGLAFDVAVHVGTLIAVIWYFRTDIKGLISAWVANCVTGKKTEESQLAWMVLIATVPAGLVGLVVSDLVETYLRSVTVIATTTILFGLLLGLADAFSSQQRNLKTIKWTDALSIGFAQALALIPGTSRSGITITAGLALGLDRVSAARFSFLMSIPIILLSGGYKGIGLLALEGVPWLEITLGATVSALTAYACIHVFLTWVNRVGMMPFVWYRLVLGIILFGLIIFGKV